MQLVRSDNGYTLTHVIPLISASLALATLAVYLLLRRRSNPAILGGVTVLCAVALWAFGCALELGGQAPETKILWVKVQFAAIQFIGAGWILFSLQYVGSKRETVRHILIPVSIALIASLGLIYTNELHGLVWTELVVRGGAGVETVVRSHGWWFYLSSLFNFTLAMSGFFILFRSIGMLRGPYRTQLLLLLAGAVALTGVWAVQVLALPVSTLMIFAAGAFVLVAVLILVAIVRFHFGDLAPLAHEIIFETMDDSLLVLDEHDRVIVANPAAQCLLGVPADQAIGQPVTAVWHEWPADLSGRGSEPAKRMVELVMADGERRSYSVAATPIPGASHATPRRVVVVQNVTHLQEVRLALQQANESLLRRNQQLTDILEVERSLLLSSDLASLLDRIVRAVQRYSGFDVVVVNLRDGDGVTRVCACDGLDQSVRDRLMGATYPWSDFEHLMQVSEQIEHCHFIPAGTIDLDTTIRGSIHRAPVDIRDGDERANLWQPDDFLLVPLMPGPNETIGVISVDVPRDGCRPDTERLRNLEVFANLAAAAIKNARLRQQIQLELEERQLAEQALVKASEELEARVSARTSELAAANDRLQHEVIQRQHAEDELVRRNHQLLSLQAAAAATTSVLDLDFVIDTVTWEMSNLLEIAKCVVYRCVDGGDKLARIGGYGPGTTFSTAAPVPPPALTRQVVGERTACQFTVGHPDTDPTIEAYLSNAGVLSLLALPLVFQEHVIGIAELAEDRRARAFTDEEISVAQLLANQAASAIENARMYEHTKREIAQRREAEDLVRASLREKEVLLKEIHHRVKNNLQVISSLLNLQSMATEDASARAMLADSQNRVRSMALIHEKLYRSDDLSRIDFREYLNTLTAGIVQTYQSFSVPIDLRLSGENVFLPVDSAVPCGLIVNELVSNALKHAFPDGRAGQIRVDLRQNNSREIRLAVSDNGIGLPETVDFRNTESLGMQLVNALVAQLGGMLDLKVDGGTMFEITFCA